MSTFDRGLRAFLAIFISVTGVMSASASAADWPSFRNLYRDGKSPDTGLLQSWPAEGPKLKWKLTDIGVGFSSATVVGDKVFITGMLNSQLEIFCLEAATGKKAWQRTHGPELDDAGNFPGVRSSATISQGMLYIMSGKGKVGCYEAAGGKPVWSREMSEFGGKPHRWGFAESVLVTKDHAVFMPGGKNCVVAVDRLTGKTAWQGAGNGGVAHYCSLTPVMHEGVAMLVGANAKGLFATNPKDGSTLWTFDFATNNTANCPSAVYSDGYIFWAVGYGKGGVCLKLDAKDGKVTAKEAWRSASMDSQHGSYIIDKGYIYGNNGGGWACLKLADGSVAWTDKGPGKGSLCFADGMLYLFAESGGKMALAKASPEKYEATGNIRLTGAKQSWAHPVVINGCLYARYDTNFYCFDVKK